MIISLIGYRATGKSTVGRILATRLSLPFFDSDQFIVEKCGRSIADVFAKEGEGHFRALECDAVKELMTMNEGVIAWGGGVVLNESNRQAISHSDQTIWLQASPKAIFARMHDDQQSDQTRPPLTNLGPMKEIETNLDSREHLYRSCADSIVGTDDKNLEAIVEQIVDGLDPRSKPAVD